MLLAHIGAVLPHDPFEAASSLAMHVLGRAPYIRRGGIVREPDLACGTVTVALEQLANLASGYFGTAEELLHQRTLGKRPTITVLDGGGRRAVVTLGSYRAGVSRVANSAATAQGSSSSIRLIG